MPRLRTLLRIVLALVLSTQATRIVQVAHDGIMLEDTSSSRPEERCNYVSTKSLKNYYFQLLLSDNTSIALHLRRDHDRPTYSVTSNAIWSAWLPAPWFTGHNDAELVWQPVPDSGPGAMQTVEQDINSIIAYLRRVRSLPGDDGNLPPNAIELHWASDPSHAASVTFVGGAYFPERVTKDSLNGRLREELTDDDFNETSILLHGVRGSLPNETAAPSHGSMFGIRAQDLEQSLTSLSTVASPLFATTLGAASIAGGRLSTGTANTITSGIQLVRQFNRFFDDRQQARYAASEKFFDKLWCHPLFTHCRASNGDDIAVPPGKQCPDV